MSSAPPVNPEPEGDALPPPRIVVLSGPSGSGKSTVVNLVTKRCRVPIEEAVSATTRPQRPGERNGRDYHFLTTNEFTRRRNAGDFLEFAEVHGAGFWYGTLKSEVDRIHRRGASVLLEIDVQGALSVMASYPEAVSIFLLTPSPEEFERRLRSRGTESETEIERRLHTAENELQYADRYRHRVINDDLDRAVAEICHLLETLTPPSPEKPDPDA